jgi:uncharacterized protein (TIGR03437 family)
MRKGWLLGTFIACCGIALGQSPDKPAAAATPTTCDSTKILSVENLASGAGNNSLGGLSKISWCEFEFPAPTTPVTSVLVHGEKAFITLQTVTPTSPVTSVILHGYPSLVPQQIVAQLPNSGVSIGSTQLQLRHGDTTIAFTSVQMEEFAPGIFTLDNQPGGPAIVQDSSTNYILPSNPAQPGQAVTVFCEGLGPTNPFVPAGTVPTGLAATITTPQVYVGGQSAVVIVSRLATGATKPSSAGVYEVTFIVPNVAAGTSELPIYLTIGSKTSNTAVLPIAP